MKNRKLVKASLAGALALGLVAGGSTFAAWSDFADQPAEAGAGYLKLSLDSREGNGTTVDPLHLAPGQNTFQEFYLASSDSGNTPDGRLTAVIEDVVDTEDGDGCTTLSEDEAESADGECGPDGELSTEATITIRASRPVEGPSFCPDAGGYRHVSSGFTLEETEDVTLVLGTLAPDNGICVRVEMSLPLTATDEVQGDDVGWNWRFDLTQV